MPQVLIFAPCERVIIDSRLNGVSIINTLEQMNLPVPEGVEVPRDINAPFRWDLLSLWYRLPGDEARRFEQRTLLRLPDGQEVLEGFQQFSFTGDTQRNVSNITGFPVGQAGVCVLRLYLREVNEEQVNQEDWRLAAEFPFRVTHLPTVEDPDQQLAGS